MNQMTIKERLKSQWINKSGKNTSNNSIKQENDIDLRMLHEKKRSPHKRRQPKASTPDGPDGPAAHPGKVQFGVAKSHCLPWRCRPHPP